MSMQVRILTIRKMMRIVERINAKTECLQGMASDYSRQGDKESAHYMLREIEGMNEIRIELMSLVQFMENDLNNDEKSLYDGFKSLAGISAALESDSNRTLTHAL